MRPLAACSICCARQGHVWWWWGAGCGVRASTKINLGRRDGRMHRALRSLGNLHGSRSRLSVALQALQVLIAAHACMRMKHNCRSATFASAYAFRRIAALASL